MAIEKARTSRNPDEKDWALQLLKECAGYRQSATLQPSEELEAVADRRKAAFESLQQRCSNLNALEQTARRGIAAELASGAIASTSAYHSLKLLQERHGRGDTRWNQAESTLIEEALYSEDPLLRREGFLALWTAIDALAPGGKERRDALMFVAAEGTINQPMSQFERLQMCATAGICDPPDLESRRPPDRLEQLYEQALARRALPADILAIR